MHESVGSIEWIPQIEMEFETTEAAWDHKDAGANF
jgi:hypothetical protein